MKLIEYTFAIALACLVCTAEAKPTLAEDNGSFSKNRQTLQGQKYQLTYLDKKRIPAFEIGGKLARIHTQGIYVTKNSLYVTGRLEHPQKRALLLRFSRDDLSQVEFLDITPTFESKYNTAAGQDHPGGFDYDGYSFWIPVAVSKPHGSTSVISVHTRLDSTLSEAAQEVAFTVDDHIGALAVDQQTKSIFGANWDTKAIYVWQTDGTSLKRFPRDLLIRDQADWALAVQDWKYQTNGTILAGGFDKDMGPGWCWGWPSIEVQTR